MWEDLCNLVHTCDIYIEKCLMDSGGTLIQSGSASPGSRASSTPREKDHETNVQFAREFVEELVENIPSDGITVLPIKEDTSRYSVAFSDISAFSESSLPDLLQPEAQYKKQVDTDTDTTDYESAVESDALSLNASLSQDRSDPTSSPDAVDVPRVTSTDLTRKVLQVDTETYEDAETSFGEASLTPSLDISAVCLSIERLHLETPQRATKDSSEGDSFLVTLNPDGCVQSADTTFNTTASDLAEIILGESFIEKSINESSVESGPLSTTFEVVSDLEVSIEYKVDIIRPLDFEVENPVASNTEADVKPTAEEPAVICVGTDLLAAVEPVCPTVESETADVESVEKAAPVDSQTIDSLEACETAAQLASTQATTESEFVQTPPAEPESLNSLAVETGLGAASEDSEKYLLIVSDQESTTSTPANGISSQADPSPAIEPEIIANESVSIVDDFTTDVVPVLQTQLESATVDLSESVCIVEKEAVPSKEPESLEKVEDHRLSTSVEPQAAETEPRIESSVIPDCELAEASSIVQDQLLASIVQSTESVPSVVLSVVQDKESEKVQDLPVVEQQALVVEPQVLIAETTESKPIVVQSNTSEKAEDLPTVEPQVLIVETTESKLIVPSNVPDKVEDFAIIKPLISTPIDVTFDTQQTVAPCVFTSDEPEIVAISSESVTVSPTNIVAELRQLSASPSFLPVDNSPLQSADFPAPEVSVDSPLPTHRQSFVESADATDIIDPVDAVWSPKADTTSCFTERPQSGAHLIDPFSSIIKQEQTSPVKEVPIEISTVKPKPIIEKVAIPFVSAFQLNSNAPSGDPFSPIPVNSTSRQTSEAGKLNRCLEGGDAIYRTRTTNDAGPVVDRSLSELRAICRRQQRELDNQRFNSDLFGDARYDSIEVDSIAAEAAKVSEDIHNASIEQIETEMDENVNPVPLDKKWLSERGGGAEKVDPRDCSPRPRMILAGGDGFVECLDKQNKNIMSSSIDAQTNQSEAGPEIALQDDETFVDSDGFDFLSSKISKGPSDRLVRESLYTKFDPLATPVVVAAPTPAPTSRHAPLPMPPKFSENTNSTSSAAVGQLVSAPAPSTSPRPSPPSFNEGPTPLTPPKSSAARALVDRLISISPVGRLAHASPVKPPPPVVVKPPVSPTMEQMSEELVLLRELLGEEEMQYKTSMATVMDKLKATELELMSMKVKVKAAEEREQKLMTRLGERVAAQKQLTAVMCEYEKTISKLVGEKDVERAMFQKEKEVIMKEKDVALGHLTNIEIAFSDVHQKYERCKTVVEAFKSNEDVLRESLAKFEGMIHKQEQKYDMLKAHAMTQLENANQELDAVRRNQATESAKLKAMLKKSELKTSSLEETLEQKVKENLELASICDDLINKVGT